MEPRRSGWSVGLRPGLLRQVVQMRAVLNAGGLSPQRHDQRFTDTPPSLAMEFSYHASSMPPQDAAGSFALSFQMADLARIKGHAGEAVSWGAESTMSPCRAIAVGPCVLGLS